ncbi:hypothetical protein NF867_17220 [Solitalea sp. MAHUQ-68]|uniref:Permuted papain-like amidase enzyme, YaeF/YiiX, C92 family n=1 Tax=Solitalea agri TaxID=2953739 RepID=A0A9X2F5P4_9SPHI|nr:YiiX/YebB-like N1pC/P60 family cysteine hydrolase [Solitalea agri]MCO4294605.1 hypothetical protein [Solitalea agri]
MIRGICFTIVFLLTVICSIVSGQTLDKIQLKNGDLLFEDLDCGPLCDAIEQVTQSYGGNHFSHIGLVYIKADSVFIIEAIGAKVQLTPLERFTGRTTHKIYIGRPKISQQVIDKALTFSVSKLGVEYDDVFLYNNEKYYCSELIYDAFKYANHNKPFFKLEPMTFKRPGSNEFFPVWIDYYKDLGTEIPEGKLGINPGGISRSNKIEILNP